MVKLSSNNEISYGIFPTHSTIISRSLADTSYFERDDHPEKDHNTSSISEESAPCHIEEEYFSKMEDITFDFEAFRKHVKPKEVILLKLNHTPLHKEFTYCSGQKFQPHNITHGSSSSNTDDLHQDFMNMPYEVQVSAQGYYDTMASCLEGSYREYTQHNDKNVLNAYSLLPAKGGKIVVIFPIYLIT